MFFSPEQRVIKSSKIRTCEILSDIIIKANNNKYFICNEFNTYVCNNLLVSCPVPNLVIIIYNEYISLYKVGMFLILYFSKP